MKYDSAFLDGDWVPVDHDTQTLVDPATEEPFAELRLAGPADVDAAVAAARRAWPAWRDSERAHRAAVLHRLRASMEERREELAGHITRDMGCPPKIADAVQVGTPLAVLDGFLATPDPREETVGNSLVVRESIGVVGAITPWNYPLHQVVAKVAPALLAGCTVVLKPSELAPSAALLFTKLIAEAGLPPGVLNVVVGTGPVVGAALAAHPGVDMVSFTGSTRAGREVTRLASDTVKRVTLELGGKSASVVLPDADLDRAVKVTVGNAFLNSGQTCTAWTRLVVSRDQHDEAAELAGKYADAMAGRLGPLASAAQWERVQGYLVEAATSGAGRLVTGGPGRLEGHDRGYFCRPTVFADVEPTDRIAQEEIFGPVLSVIPYADIDEAVEIANGTAYGLAGAVWSGDEAAALALARRLRTGQVDVNGGRFNPAAPFGGYGQSGNGRELGSFGLEEYYEVKSLQLP